MSVGDHKLSATFALWAPFCLRWPGNNSSANKLQVHPHTTMQRHSCTFRHVHRIYIVYVCIRPARIICTLVLSPRYHYNAISIYTTMVLGYTERSRAPLFAPSARVSRRRSWCIVECVNAPRKMRVLWEKVVSCTNCVHVLLVASDRIDSTTNSYNHNSYTRPFTWRKVHFVIKKNIR